MSRKENKLSPQTLFVFLPCAEAHPPTSVPRFSPTRPNGAGERRRVGERTWERGRSSAFFPSPKPSYDIERSVEEERVTGENSLIQTAPIKQPLRLRA